MDIYIDDIPDEGLTIKTDSDRESWLKNIVKDVEGERYSKKDKATLIVTLLNCEGNIDIRGHITVLTHPFCDRCLNMYNEEKEYPLHAVMSPLYETKRKRDRHGDQDKELVHEDLDFGFYEGDRINLSEFLREQILLAKPIKHICKEECKGICQNCGKNLNKGPCKCKTTKTDSRWEVLKGFKH